MGITAFHYIIRRLGTKPVCGWETARSAEVDVIDDDGACDTSVFEVGSGQNGALLAEKLGRLHILDVAAEDDMVVRADDEFAVADIEAAVAANDDLGLTLTLGDVAESVEGDLLCHFHAECGSVLRFFLFKNVQQ